MKMKVAFIISLIFLLSFLSGCIGESYINKVAKFLTPPQKYEWIKKVEQKSEFSLLDIINRDMAKVEDYPFVIENGTEYLHIYIETNFSNPINPEWECLSQGKINVTIIGPIENETKYYTTFGKSNKYKDFIYFVSPSPGSWKIIVKATGTGKYEIMAEAYQPV